MIIFGINVPLPEILLLLIILFAVFLIMILRHIQKLQSMSVQSRSELAELSRIAQEEREDLEKISGYEKSTAENLKRFEKELMELEQETDTLYIKKLAPDLYKIQNYTLWALKKGFSDNQIKENLKNKGWKDNDLIQMIINDTLKYTDYYKDKKGKVEVPSVKIEEVTRVIKSSRSNKVEKKKPTPLTEVKGIGPKTEKKLKKAGIKTAEKLAEHPKKLKKTKIKSGKAKKIIKHAKKLTGTRANKRDSLDEVEKKLKRMEKDLDPKKSSKKSKKK